MMLAPARLNLPLTTVEEGLDCDDFDKWNGKTSIDSLRHDYLHSLVYAQRWLGVERKDSRVFCLSLPETIGPLEVSQSLGGYRSLPKPFGDSKEMAAVVVEENALPDTAPSSPPDLSYSKSSKSSSVDSDSSDDDASPKQSVQIEDIGNERRSIEDRNLKPESRPTLKRPPPRSAATIDGTRRVSAPHLWPSPPIGSKENRYPSLQGAVSGVLRDQSLNLPYGRGLRRGFTNPSLPSLIMHGSPNQLSRSPSPTKPFMHNGVSVSPQMLASATPRLSADSRSPNPNGTSPLVKRHSWQPGRKSVKELEAECNDEDEEVPDEAILENVPISPMPGQSRQSRSATPSPQRSPHRRPLYTNLHPSHTNLHSANVPKNAKRPSAPTVMPNGQYGTPRSPRHSRMPTLTHSATMPQFPLGSLHRKQRSKSWTEDLNEEAKQLSAALEDFADRQSMDKTGSGTNSVASSPPRPSLTKQRAKTTILDLHPGQKGNIMMDPLPISKEKEAVLSRTRPSWLPPKDPKEDQKHMREWGQMMARAAENEKKRALKEREAQETQEELQDSLARIWDNHILPNWDTVIKEPRTRELWWRGVTPRSRGLVWQIAIGNELELSDSSFNAALMRAAELEETVAEMTTEERAVSKEAAWFDAIARDVLVASPEIQAPEHRAPFQNALRDVLKAYAMYRSDIGYVYGTHLVAGVLCRYLRPVKAFVALANMLNRPLPLAFLVNDTKAMARTYDLVLSTLKYKLTKLHDHLTSPAIGLKPEEYLDPIFRCIFAYHLPTEHVSRVWDIYVFEGDKALIRAAVAVLGRLERYLYGSRDEVLDIMGWRNDKLWDVGPAEEFIKAVREAGKVDSKGEVRAS